MSFIENFQLKFYMAFIAENRWTQYIEGVGTTLLATALALVLGLALGVLVALVRTAHDQQRPGRHNPVLAVLNVIAKV